MSETKDLSSQVQDTTKDTASKEQESPVLIVPIAVNLESIPRSGAVVVNDAGDVLDDAGNIVGKIADTDNLKNLVGNTVNTASDVISSSGDVLGKTLPIGQGKPEEEDDSHDEAKSEYTTQSKDKKSGGLENIASTVTGAVGDTAKGATEAVGDTAKNVGETGKSDATSQATDKKTPTETPKAPGVKYVTPDDKSEDQDQKDISLEDRDVPADGEDKLKEVAPEEAKETTDNAEETAEDVPEGAKDISEEAKENFTSKVDEQDVPKPEDVEDKLQEKTEGAKDDLPKSEAPEVPEGDVPKPEAPGDDGDKSKASGDDLKSVVPGGEAAGATDEVKSKATEGEEDTEGKAAEGEETAEGKVTEGEEVSGGVGEEAKDKAAKGEEAVEDKAAEGEEAAKEPLDFTILKGTTVNKEGNLVNEKGDKLGKVVEGELKQLIGLYSNDQGIIWDRTGKAVGKAEPLPEWERGEQKDYSILNGTTVDKNGNLVNEKGHLFGKIIEGEIKQLIGLTSDDQGIIWDRTGKAVGKAEPLPEWERGEQKDFSILKGAVVYKEGGLVNDKGDTIGKVTEGEIRQLIGLKSDENGKIWRDGKVVGQAEPLPEWDRVPKKDYSILKGTKVNKVGKLVGSNGTVLGKVVEGDLKELLGKRSDENGDIWNDFGEVIGKGEPVSVAEREEKSSAPFEHFPGATVESDGRVMYQGEQVGEVIEGNPKELKGSQVDEDGDILDRRGNTIGKAKRWEAPEEEPEKPIDNSALAGKRVNKAGNLVSESGEIYGRVIEGDVKKLVGRMSDREGNIRSESGDIIGKAELVSEGERGGKKDSPFAGLKNCIVSKDGKVVNQAGETVGRLVIGDAKALVGRAVDDDGEIVDSNGNVIGKAERWEEPEKEQKHNPLAGRRVNREGNVVDADGNIIGKLTSGELLDCAGKEIDEDGDVFNQKGSVIGHVSLLEDIPKEEEPEPEGETEEERIKREQAEADEKKQAEEAEKNKKLAQSLAYQIEQTLERLRPICKSIKDKISAAEAQKPEDRDEEELVRQVKPLIEEGGKILTETNGIIRGLDPDSRISRNAKQKTAAGEATPEEAHLANLLKELSTEIQTTIEEGKRKLEGMPHTKKEINPLWALLAEPLFQIVAAVGLLLSGVLGLVGKLLGPILSPLLNGLGLGGLLDGLLGGLGLKKILSGLGLGVVVGTVTGKK
ncbi:hypothetical protein BKA60DRAFT_685071 [Fusarium oxysporum]|nr:hypothetical protein BKA60DRAFT_685071 [Fusarium oxysporum]